jgi:hypothetical protein
MTNERTNKQQAFGAATRRFPLFELPIKRLIETDENFRDICEELAEAESALSAVDKLPAPLRETRRAEWQALVDRLVGEVEAAIGRPGSRTGH